MSRIKDLPVVERPREKIEKYGPEKLTDAELLAILLRTGTKGLSAIDLSKKILKIFSSETIISARVSDLKKVFGFGTTKACEIVACFELGKRFLSGKQACLILSDQDVWSDLKEIRDSKKEHFVVFYLDARSQKIQREIISIGTLTESLVHPREVFEPAIKNNASEIIVAHNHPSGSLIPSESDIDVTKKLVHAGKILGIPLLKHVIVTKNGAKIIDLD